MGSFLLCWTDPIQREEQSLKVELSTIIIGPQNKSTRCRPFSPLLLSYVDMWKCSVLMHPKNKTKNTTHDGIQAYGLILC